MTNYPFKSIDEFQDIECISAYRQLVGAGLRSPEDMLDAVCYKSRDNARTPMQWNAEKNAGFTDGTPWLKINPNYLTVNARAEEEDPGSVLQFYRELLRLRRKSEWKDLLVYGSYELLLKEDPQVFAYLRTYGKRSALVAVNMSAQPAAVNLPEETAFRDAVQILGTKGRKALETNLELQPWEALVWAW